MNKCTRCGEVNPAEIHTCSPQTKAQRLAADLNLNHTYCPEEVIKGAAAELHRLDALNADLIATLEKLARLGNGDHYGNSLGNEIAIDALIRARRQEND